MSFSSSLQNTTKSPIKKISHNKDSSTIPKEKHSHIILEYEKQQNNNKNDKSNNDDKIINPPSNWEETYNLILNQRKKNIAPVDNMGCDALADKTQTPKIRRYQTLISLMLSSQTKDEITANAMIRLRNHGLTPDNIIKTDINTLELLIKPVGFYKRKALYIKQTSQMLIDNYNGDIPDTIEGLTKLKGVGPKMAYLTYNTAFNKIIGIGVDVHVHRITNRLGWVNTKTPEGTRKELESWLPKEKWGEINTMLVGFGQTICKSSPKCNECSVNSLCPSVKIPKKKKK